ncbi:hypothetical protein CAI21_04495 [Alkalilimnicola ehrlichii]|uniref:Protein kinase domain-containing protein n=2 Tax=Alkalilimnicola ehrlichii TaxID=351052 RepID=A0A3E0WZ96_9GAMM|nr:serine/threonine-protein kinase [Alkalilimnicola ehrlichii]RFA30772.1 hypothetical protein CAI21_04495 [Alkalilimnicola ehrlichii]RFA38348.1 hypothetical protein CAL65_05860 [Alkalilimnicola ehrlichii]
MIPGYTAFGHIHTGSANLIEQARREYDGRPVVLKQPLSTTPTTEQVSRYRHEFELLRQLHLNSTVQAYGLELSDGKPVLVLERCPGHSLNTLMKEGALDLEERLQIGAELAAAISELHSARVIHKGIQPKHAVYDSTTGRIKLIDFSQASRLNSDEPDFNRLSPSVDLRYISPEQTGRMQQVVDYRSDLYSLGITLYELLGGAHPFAEREPLEIAHCHIAHQPPHLASIAPDLSPSLCAIVMKLLAKNPEERYQSALGVQRDIEACLHYWRTDGKIPTLPLQRFDIPDRVVIPQALYGREEELKLLLKAFDRVDHQHKELLLVSGYSGIGKSALVHGLQEAVTGRHGWFITGKAQLHERNRPYSVLATALRELAKHLLTEPEKRLKQWREAILSAANGNGQVIIDLTPEIEHIIGPQPPAAAVTPEAIRNVFQHVLHNFFRIFCRPDHPLVLYLDDLQWADSASLSVVERLLRDSDLGHLMIVGTYRHNAVDQDHPLTTLLNQLKSVDLPATQVELGPLPLSAITAFVADALHSPPNAVAPLAELVYQKTDGNPFFAGQLLRDLHSKT